VKVVMKGDKGVKVVMVITTLRFVYGYV